MGGAGGLGKANIVVLGPNGSGKTCYMLAMYHAFKEGVGEFTLHTKDDDLGLYFEEAWFSIWKGRFLPEPTQITDKPYSFEFRHRFDVWMDFDWMDYRGGVLTARREATDIASFRQLVRRADCLFLCISGEHLQQAIRGRVRDIISDGAISRMRVFCDDAGPIPTVVLVTKSDLLHHRRRAEMLADVRRLFKPWFDDKRPIMICPVSVIDRENRDLPIVFFLYVFIRKQIAQAEKALRALRAEMEGRTSSCMGWVRETFGNLSNRKLRESIKRRNADLKRMMTRIQPLTDRLWKASLYYDNKEQ
jgi:hypothetical protein